MFDYQIIIKESDEKVSSILKEELSKKKVDPFKITALIELGANGFDLVINNKSTLQIAVENKLHTTIATILEHSNETHKSDIWNAFEKSNQLQDFNGLMTFIKSGKIVVNRKENNRQTALMLAVKYNNLKFAKELLKLRANMHASDENNTSVLDYAMESKSKEMINFIQNVIKKDSERIEKQREKSRQVAHA